MTEHDSFIQDSLDLFDEYLGLAALTLQLDADAYKALLGNRLMITTRPRREVRPFLNRIRKDIHTWRKTYFVHATKEQLIKLIRDIQAGPEELPIAWVSKEFMESAMDLNRVNPKYSRLPAHARIGISLHKDPRVNLVPLWLLEARLYEDMASLFNEALNSLAVSDSLDGWMEESKPALKRTEALFHATFVSVFQFLEAYLNGIASDILLERQVVDEHTRALLTEIPRFVPLRQKALQYPKLYLDVTHPLYTETNSKELSLLLVNVKIRDSLVHPSVFSPDEIWSKELSFFSLGLKEVEATIDAAIEFVLKVETAIGRNSILLEWILPRGTNGTFPSESFK